MTDVYKNSASFDDREAGGCNKRMPRRSKTPNHVAPILHFPIPEERGKHISVSWDEYCKQCAAKAQQLNPGLNVSGQLSDDALRLVGLIAHRLTAEALFSVRPDAEDEYDSFPIFGVWAEFAPQSPDTSSSHINEPYSDTRPLDLRECYRMEYTEFFCDFVEDVLLAMTESNA